MLERINIADPSVSDGALVSIPEICQYLRIARASIDRLIAKGEFPEPQFTMGRLRRWRVGDIRKFSGDKSQPTSA